MHYHLQPDLPSRPNLSHKMHKLLGLVCLAVFLALTGMIWLPYGQAFINATAITILPPDWAQSYITATLPKTALAKTDDKLIINTPNLRIEAPIVEGHDPQSLLKGVGHDPKSSAPGEQGRVVISGHRFWPDRSPYATIFFSLDKLKIGDSITLKYKGGTYTYNVTETWDVPKEEAYPYLAPSTLPILTIYTCGPTPYSAKNRLGFNAILDQKDLKKDSDKAIQALQDGVF